MAVTRIKNNQITDSTITYVKLEPGTITGDRMNPNLTFNSNLVLNGNLTVTGNVTAVQSTTTQITDPLLTLGLGNAGTSYDLGLILTRGSGGNRFLGWKENEAAFVFINTTEDGLTSGNIATTTYSNVILGNITSLGGSVFGNVRIANNLIDTTQGALTIASASDLITLANNVVASDPVVLSSTLSVVGASTLATLETNTTATIGTSATVGTTLVVGSSATVNSLVSNGAISGTAITGSGTATVETLVVNTSGDFGTYVTADGGLQNTPIGNATANTGKFTTVEATGAATLDSVNVNNAATIGTTLTVTGNATVNNLTVNNAINFSSGTIAGNLTVGDTTTTNILVVNTTGNFGTDVTIGDDLSVVGTATVNDLVSNTTAQIGTSASVGTTLDVAGTATVNALVSNTTGQFGTDVVVGDELSVVGTATVEDLVTNATATIGSSATVDTTLTVGGTATAQALVSNTSITAATGQINGNLLVEGNLRVMGNLSYINVDEFIVQDPIIQLNTGPNGAPLTVDDGFDVGVRAHYYDGADQSAFFGYKDSSGFFEYFSKITSESGNVIAGTYGTIKSGNLQTTGLASIGTTLATGGTATLNALVTNTTATIGTSATIETTLVTGGTATVNALVSNTTGQFGTDVVIGDELSVVGVATVNSLVSNTTGQFGTDVTVGDDLSVVGTTTTNDLAVNTSAVITTFASVGTNLTVGGNITGGNIIANNALLVSSIGATGDIISTAGNIRANAGQMSAVSGVFSGDVQISGNLNVNVNVTATSSGVFYGNATTGINALYAGKPTGYTILPNVVAQFTTDTNHYAQINTQNLNSGTEASSDFVATADDGDDSNYFVDLGIGSSTYDYAAYPAYGPHDSYLLNNGGNLIINTDTAGKAINFIVGGTDVTENVVTMHETKLQVTQTTASTSWDTGALIVDGGVGIAGDLNVKGTSTTNLGNVQIANNTVTAITTNGNINLNANGTGDVTINSGLNNSRTVINGTAADLFVVDGTQVSVGAAPSGEATFQIHADDAMLLPVGAVGDRPLTPAAGMFRFSTSSNKIEWYDGTVWDTPQTAFTVIVANTQTGNGSATTFTLPVANASTAGTIISINGIVQEPVTAYSITGNVVTFTEAPLSTDNIDFRVLTTTTQVTAITDGAGTTGIFMDEPSAGSDIVTFKVNGTESFSIQANSEVKAHGNIVPSANVTYDLGSSAYRWRDLYLSGSTIKMGNIVIKEDSGSVAFYQSNGTTPAQSYFGNIIPSANVTYNIGSSTARFVTVYAQATSALYADLAEKYTADADYAPGTVVEFGGEQEVTVCTHDMCRKVAGVVSTAPAYIMNDGLVAEHTATVALQGRVPCRVTGTVRKGDLMVSAGNGCARADADPKVGTVIGKALENFDGVEGVIEVVVGRF